MYAAKLITLFSRPGLPCIAKTAWVSQQLRVPWRTVGARLLARRGVALALVALGWRYRPARSCRGGHFVRVSTDRTSALHAIGHRSAIVHIVPDRVWPEMWRIRHPDGRLSDMANLAWARDGAVAVAMRLLDPRKGKSPEAKPTASLPSRRKAEQRVPVSPPMRQIEEAATLVAN